MKKINKKEARLLEIIKNYCGVLDDEVRILENEWRTMKKNYRKGENINFQGVVISSLDEFILIEQIFLDSAPPIMGPRSSFYTLSDMDTIRNGKDVVRAVEFLRKLNVEVPGRPKEVRKWLDKS